jgi:hypothetical protein
MPIRDNFTPEEAEFIIAATMKNKGLKRADAERLMDRDRPAKRNPLLDSQWVHNFSAICGALREGRAEPAGLFVSVFWIRLYGVLVDLRNRYRKSAEAHRYALERGGSNAFNAASAEVFDACVAIYQALSDDELIYATFVRHTEAHVYQESFEYEVERGNPAQNQPAAIRTKQLIAPLRRHVDVDEAHRVVDVVLQRVGYDETRVTVNIAHKIGTQVERLDRAMTALDVERKNDQSVSAARRPSIEGSWPQRR